MKNIKFLYVLTAIFLLLPVIASAQPTYDLDIADNLGNLIGNTMSLSITPGYSGAGQFWLVNPNQYNNVDPDPYGNQNLSNIYYAKSDLNHLTAFFWIPEANITVGLTPIPYSLNNGNGVFVNVEVTVPSDQIEGEYETWISVYDNVRAVRDSFKLKVMVGVQEDVDIVEENISGAGQPNGELRYIGSFTVLNPTEDNNPDPDYFGNVDLYNLNFAAQNFINITDSAKYINSANVYLAITGVFGPTPVAQCAIDQLALGDSAFVEVWIACPQGTPGGAYQGQVRVIDDDGWPSDVVGVTLDLSAEYDLDISDNTGNLVGNWMEFTSAPGMSIAGYFFAINPNNPDLNVDPDPFGNMNLDNIDWSIDDLVNTTNFLAWIPASEITLSVANPFSLNLGASEMIWLTVNIPENQEEGEYTTWVRLVDRTSGVGDSFQLRLYVRVQEDIDIVEDNIWGSIAADNNLTYFNSFIVMNPTAARNPDPDGPGNVNLYNIRFVAQNFIDTANPNNYIHSSNVYIAVTGVFGPTPVNQARLDQLVLGDSAFVEVWVTVPRGTYGAVYQGQVQMIDDDGWPSDVVGLTIEVPKAYDLDIADNQQNLIGNKLHLAGMMGDIRSGYFRLVNPNSTVLNVDPDPFGNADFDSISYSVTTLTYMPGGARDISYTIDPSQVSVSLPYNLMSGVSYDGLVTVNIPTNTFSGVYRGYVTVIGYAGGEPTSSDQFILEVSVGAIDDIDIAEASVTGGANHGLTANTGIFTVWSTDALNNPDPDGPGNTTLYGVTFVAQDLRYGNNVIPAENVSFVPAMIDSIKPGQSYSVYARVNIPFGKLYGLYTGLAIATNNTNTTSDTVRIRLSVYPTYDLDISDNTGNLVENRMTLSHLPGAVVSGSYMLINPNSPELNIDPDPFGNAPLWGITWSVGNLYHHQYATAYLASTNITGAPGAALASGASELVTLNVSIPYGQIGGLYSGIVRVWDATQNVRDSFELRVIVEPQEDLDIVENMISRSVGAGDSLVYIGRFSVVNPTFAYNPDPDSVGNVNLDNLRFSSENLIDSLNPTRIIPAEQIYIGLTGQAYPTPLNLAAIDLLALGDMADVSVWAYLPRGTFASIYRGQMTVIDDDGTPGDVISVRIDVLPYYDLDIADNEQNLIGNKMTLAGQMGSSQTGYFRLINPNSVTLNVDPDPFGNANFTGLSYVATTLNFVPVPGTDILTSIPAESVVVTLPSVPFVSGASANVPVLVKLPRNTRAGTYRGTVTVTGMPGSVSDMFTLDVVIGSVDDLDIDSIAVHTQPSGHGTSVVTTPFRVYSTDALNNPDPDGPGNTVLYGISFTARDLRLGARFIPSENITFLPTLIDSIRPGEFKTVTARVNIPLGTYTGTYSGFAFATNASGTTMDSVNIIVPVSASYDLDIADNEQNLVGNKMTLSGPMGSQRTGFFRMINPNTPDLNVDPDPFGNANFTGFGVSIDTLRYVVTGLEDISYVIPPQQCTVIVPEGLISGASDDARVRVRLPQNTFAGTYRGWVTITGTPGEPPATVDRFMLEVIVTGIDDLDIDSVAVHASSAQGTLATTGSFSVYSTDAATNVDSYDGPGNTTLYGVSFTASDLRNGARFIPAANVALVPAGFDSIHAGTFKTAYARVNVPYGTYAGIYTGTAIAMNNSATTSDTVQIIVNVTSSYDLDISDNEQNLIGNKMRLAGMMGTNQTGYFRLINPDRPENNVDPDPYGNSDFTGLSYTPTALSYVSMPGVKINITIPASAVTFCDSTPPLNWGASKNVGLRVAIPSNVLAGTYRGTVSVTGTPGNSTDNFVLEVVVGAIEDLDIAQASVSASGNQGGNAQTSAFTVWSTDAANNPDPDGPGNTTLYGINFTASDLRMGTRFIPSSNIEFVPSMIDSLYPGTSASVYARIAIPYGTYEGIYSGLALARNNSGSTSDTVRIIVTVNKAYDLDIADNMAGLVTNKMTLRLVPNMSASGQFLLVNPDRNENNYDPDPFGNSDLSGIRYRVSEILVSPDNYTLAGSAISFTNNPINLAWGASANVTVNALIEPSQPYATYYGTVTVCDTVGEGTVISDYFNLEVVVGPREAFEMPDSIFIRAYPGEFGQTVFGVTNTGNKTIERIEVFAMTDFVSAGGVRIPKSALEFSPPILIDSMRIAETESVWARVNIPKSALATRYTARAKAMQQRGDPAKNFIVVLDVGYRPQIDEGIVFSDNPVTGNYVKIGYWGEPGKPVKLMIMNMAAEIVHTKDLQLNEGTNSGVYTWYLKNDKEDDVAYGMYVVITQFTTTENEQEVNKVFTKKLLIVR